MLPIKAAALETLRTRESSSRKVLHRIHEHVLEPAPPRMQGYLSLTMRSPDTRTMSARAVRIRISEALDPSPDPSLVGV